jgi:DNA invertase Pin-like site-specific DNA recombinase
VLRHPPLVRATGTTQGLGGAKRRSRALARAVQNGIARIPNRELKWRRTRMRYGRWAQTMGKSTQLVRAFAYLRTSSASNIGEDKDSGRRQLHAIQTYAKRAGVDLVGTYNDEAVKGSDPIDTRPGFAAMLEALEANGTKTIVVETANRFARDLMVQEVGFSMLRARGIDLIAADSPTSFLDDTPTARLIRQVLGAVSEFEKAMLVAKLRGARDRKRRMGMKVEGRKSVVSAALADAGHTTKSGKPYAPTAVKNMLARVA